MRNGTGTGTLSTREYADVAAYTALECVRRGNQTGASVMMENLSIMFDGQGLVDEPYQNGPLGELGIYQTYKLALYVHLQAKQYGVYPGLVERLLRMQNPEGGFHTGYDDNGTYAGTLANAETTSIVIIVLSQLTGPRKDVCLPFPLLCMRQLLDWIILYYVVAGIAGTAITLAFFYRDRRKTKTQPVTSAFTNRPFATWTLPAYSL